MRFSGQAGFRMRYPHGQLIILLVVNDKSRDSEINYSWMWAIWLVNRQAVNCCIGNFEPK